MSDNVIKLVFDKKRNTFQSRYAKASKHKMVTDIFSGSSLQRPSLISNKIIEDLKKRIRQAESYGQFKIHTKVSMCQIPHASIVDDLSEARVEFFLQKNHDELADRQKAMPFLILKARHQKDGKI